MELASFQHNDSSLVLHMAFVNAEDVAEDVSEDHEEVISTIYNRPVPQQSPESNGEPFATYFDEKIPIPEDEKVSVAGPQT